VVGKPGSTQRFELKADPEEEDAFKRHVPPGAEDAPKGRPRTVRIKRKTAAAGAAGAAAAAALAPPETLPAVPEAETVDEAAPPAPPTPPSTGKSQTARIDLPPEVAAGRPKTIKIKRSDGPAPAEKPAAAPPKPAASAAAAKAAAAKAPKVKPTPLAAASDAPGALFSVLALVAVLVVCALIYMLLAQTFVPSLPFPGKLGV
jgi:hypothetical protein